MGKEGVSHQLSLMCSPFSFESFPLKYAIYFHRAGIFLNFVV